MTWGSITGPTGGIYTMGYVFTVGSEDLQVTTLMSYGTGGTKISIWNINDIVTPVVTATISSPGAGWNEVSASVTLNASDTYRIGVYTTSYYSITETSVNPTNSSKLTRVDGCWIGADGYPSNTTTTVYGVPDFKYSLGGGGGGEQAALTFDGTCSSSTLSNYTMGFEFKVGNEALQVNKLMSFGADATSVSIWQSSDMSLVKSETISSPTGGWNMAMGDPGAHATDTGKLTLIQGCYAIGTGYPSSNDASDVDGFPNFKYTTSGGGAPPVDATIVHCRPSGGSSTYPYDTFAKAFNDVDTLPAKIAQVNGGGAANYNLTATQKRIAVYLHTGTYADGLDNVILGDFTTSGNYFITLMAAPDETPVWSTGNNSYAGSIGLVVTADYTKIQGITFDNNFIGVWLWNGSECVEISDCTAYDNYHAFHIEALFNTIGNLNRNRIHHCTAYNNIRGVVVATHATNCEVYECDLYNNEDGIAFYAQASGSVPYDVDNCTIHHNRIYSNTACGVYMQSYSSAADLRNNVFQYNTIRDNVKGFELSNYAGENGAPTVIKNNVIYSTGSQSRGISMDSTAADYIYITNNTIYNHTYGIYSVNDASGCQAKNNIFGIPNLGYGIYCAGTDVYTAGCDYNDFYKLTSGYVGYYAGTRTTLANWRAGTPYGDNSLEQNPLFINADYGDFHLSSASGHWNEYGWKYDAETSPLIDAGDPAISYSDEPVPNGERSNMGAYGACIYASKTSAAPTVLHCEGGNSSSTLTIYDANPEFSAIPQGTYNSPCSIVDNFDNGDLTGWTMGGTTGWVAESSTVFDGANSAKSGAITHNQQSSMEKNITVPDSGAILTFWWKVSCEAHPSHIYDRLEFYIDGDEEVRISGETGWEFRSFALAPGSYTIKWNYYKDPATSVGADAGYVDEISLMILDNFENGNLSGWTMTGSAAWSADTTYAHTGTYSARSGVITHNQDSQMEKSINVPPGGGNITFRWKASCEYHDTNTFDRLEFYIDTTEKARISGDTEWRFQSFYISEGTHSIKWRYYKDGAASEHQDAGWVDDIICPGSEFVASNTTHMEIEVDSENDWDGIYRWDTGRYDITDLTDDNRSQDLQYAGTPLSTNTQYYWRVKFYNGITDFGGSAWAYGQFRTGDELGHYRIYYQTTGANNWPHGHMSDACNTVSQVSDQIAALNGDNNSNPGGTGTSNYNLSTRQNKFTLILDGGTYTERLFLSSSFTAAPNYFITVRPDASDTVILSYASSHVVDINADYTKVYDLRATNATANYQAGFNLNADYVHLEGCKAYNCYDGMRIGAGAGMVSYCNVFHCDTYSNLNRAGIFIREGLNYLDIYNCAIYDNPTEGLYFSIQTGGNQSNVTVRDCKIYSSGAAGRGIRLSSSSTGCFENFVINNNRLYSVGTSQDIGISTEAKATSVQIINNTFYNNRVGVNQSSAVGDVTVKNNIFAIRDSATGYGVYVTGAGYFTLSDYNNFYRLGAGGYTGYDGTTSQTSLGDWQGATPYDDNSLEADPQFVDAANSEFHLKSQAGHYNESTMGWDIDGSTSSGVDGGDPGDDYSLEPDPDGTRINQGAYGNTPYASRGLFGAPAGFACIAHSSDSLTWSWVEVVQDEGYQILDNTTGAITIDDIAANSAFTTETGLSANTLYVRKIRCFKDGKTTFSDNSNIVSTYTFTGQATGFAFTDCSSTSFSMQCDEPPSAYADSTAVKFNFVTGGAGANNSAWLTSNTFTDSNLVPNTTYQYRAIWRNGDGTEDTPGTTFVKCTPANMPAMFNTSATFTSQNETYITAAVGLNSNPGGTIIELFYALGSSSQPTGPWISAGIKTSGYSWDVGGLTPDSSYWFRAHARNHAGIYTNNCSITAWTTELFAEPTGFSVSNYAEDFITWTWNDRSGSEDGFQLLDNASQDVAVDDIAADSTFTTETGLSANTLCDRMVRCFKSGKTIFSDNSNIASIYTLVGQATGFAFTGCSTTSISMQSDEPPNAYAGSTAQRFEFVSGGSGGTSTGWLITNSYTDSGLARNTTYQYRAIWRNGNGIQGTPGPTFSKCTLANTPYMFNSSSTFTFANTDTITALVWTSGNPSGTQIELFYGIGTETVPPGSYASAGIKTSGYSWTLGSLNGTTWYWFKARAINYAGVMTSNCSNTRWCTIPATPGNFSCEGCSSSTLTWGWNDVAGETGYDLFADSGTAIITNISPNTISTVETGLSPNTTYNRLIKAFLGTGPKFHSGSSNQISACTLSTLPVMANSTSTFTAENETCITVNVDENGNPSGTTLELFSAPDSGGTPGAWVSEGTLASGYIWVVSGLTPGASYWYKARARNWVGIWTGNCSVTVWNTEAVSAPAGLYAPSSNRTASSLTWVWTDTSILEEGFQLLDNSTGAVVIDDIALNATYTTESGLAANTSYDRKVRAFSSGKTEFSDNSNIVLVYTLTGPATGFVFTDCSSTSLSMQCDEPPNAYVGSTTIYFQWVSGTAGGTSSGYITLNTYSDAGLSPNTTYGYRVYWRNGNGVLDSPTATLYHCTLAAIPSMSNSSSTFTIQNETCITVLVGVNGNPTGTVIELFCASDVGGAPGTWYSAGTSDSGYLWDVSDLESDSTYWFKARARNWAGKWSDNCAITVWTTEPFSAPADMDFMNRTSTSITWTWTDRSGLEEGYQIIDNATGLVIIDNIPPNATYTTETGLSENTTYNRICRGYKDGKSTFSDNSNVATVRTPIGPIANFRCAGCSSATLTWAWDDYAIENAYQIMDNTNGVIVVGSIPQDSTYTIETGLTPNTTYKRHIRGYVASSEVGILNSTYSGRGYTLPLDTCHPGGWRTGLWTDNSIMGGFVKFGMENLPATAVVDSVKLYAYCENVTGYSSRNFDIKRFDYDPEPYIESDQGDEIIDLLVNNCDVYLYNGSEKGRTVGSWNEQLYESEAVEWLMEAIENSYGNVTLGVIDTGGAVAGEYCRHCGWDNETAGNRPYLEVGYEIRVYGENSGVVEACTAAAVPSMDNTVTTFTFANANTITAQVGDSGNPVGTTIELFYNPGTPAGPGGTWYSAGTKVSGYNWEIGGLTIDTSYWFRASAKNWADIWSDNCAVTVWNTGVEVSETYYWRGTTNTAWTTGTNWSPNPGASSVGVAPLDNVDVIIEAPVNMPVMPAQNIYLNNILINTGNSCTGGTGNCTVIGQISGAGSFTGGSGTLKLTYNGTPITLGTGQFSATAGTVSYEGSGNQVIWGDITANYVDAYRSLNLAGGGTKSINLPYSMDITRTLTVDGVTFSISPSGKVIRSNPSRYGVEPATELTGFGIITGPGNLYSLGNCNIGTGCQITGVGTFRLYSRNNGAGSVENSHLNISSGAVVNVSTCYFLQQVASEQNNLDFYIHGPGSITAANFYLYVYNGSSTCHIDGDMTVTGTMSNSRGASYFGNSAFEDMGAYTINVTNYTSSGEGSMTLDSGTDLYATGNLIIDGTLTIAHSGSVVDVDGEFDPATVTMSAGELYIADDDPYWTWASLPTGGTIYYDRNGDQTICNNAPASWNEIYYSLYLKGSGVKSAVGGNYWRVTRNITVDGVEFAVTSNARIQSNYPRYNQESAIDVINSGTLSGTSGTYIYSEGNCNVMSGSTIGPVYVLYLMGRSDEPAYLSVASGGTTNITYFYPYARNNNAVVGYLGPETLTCSQLRVYGGGGSNNVTFWTGANVNCTTFRPVHPVSTVNDCGSYTITTSSCLWNGNIILDDGGDLVVNGDFTLAGNLSIAHSGSYVDINAEFDPDPAFGGGYVSMSAGNLYIADDDPSWNWLSTPSGGTVHYDSPGAQSINSVIYNNLSLAGNNTKWLTANTTVNDSVLISGGAAFYPGNRQLLVGTAFNMNGGKLFSDTPGAAIQNASGSFTSSIT
ncbi:MAG: right-handed parallel beta-helix repeat-containing protein, partial [Planctomycetota bacterium]